MISTKISRRVLAGFAAATLSLGVVACSEAEEGLDTAGSAAAEATDSIGDAVGGDDAGSSEPADSTDTDDTDDTDSAEGDSVEVEGADGSTFQVPAAVAQAIDSYSSEFGAPVDVEESDNGTLVSFDEGNYLAYAEELGAQPVIGMIAESWVDEGGLDADVGLPTGPEEANADGNGWIQQFANGSISWIQGDDGDFESEIER